MYIAWSSWRMLFIVNVLQSYSFFFDKHSNIVLKLLKNIKIAYFSQKTS